MCKINATRWELTCVFWKRAPPDLKVHVHFFLLASDSAFFSRCALKFYTMSLAPFSLLLHRLLVLKFQLWQPDRFHQRRSHV